MNKYLTGILLIFWGQAFAQNTFSKRYHFGLNTTQLGAVIATDSCFYISGTISPTDNVFFIKSLFAKLDLEGNVEYHKTLTEPNVRYETWLPTLHILPDGGFVNTGYKIDTTMKAFLVRYNQYGDTIFTREYFSPLYPEEDFIRPFGLQPIEGNKGFYLSAYFNPVIDDAEGDILVLKLDSLGNVLHENIYGGDLTEDGGTTILGQNGNLIVGAVKTNSNFVWKNYIRQSYIFQINADGFIEWEYETPSNRIKDIVRGMATTEDGGIVAASTGGYEEVVNPLASIFIWDSAYFFKIDSNQNKVWQLEVFDSISAGPGGEMAPMISVDNGEAYIACGRHNLIRSIDPIIAGHFAWFFKFSDEGKLIWIRKHQLLDTQGHRHKIYDLKQTPDGGLIAAGEIRGNFGDGTPGLQGWLLKLDEHGCLIPGCEANDTVTSSTDLPVEMPVELAIHPNPASDYLNFHLRTTRVVQSASFRIIDANGRVMKEFVSSMPKETHILPVNEWPIGVYFLQYIKNSEVVTSEKFIVQ